MLDWCCAQEALLPVATTPDSIAALVRLRIFNSVLSVQLLLPFDREPLPA